MQGVFATSKNNNLIISFVLLLKGDPNNECDEDDNVEKLRKEAVMPISDVMAQYAGLANTPVFQRLTGGASKPISPFLKAKQPKASGGKFDIN